MSTCVYVELCEHFLFIKPTLYDLWGLHNIYRGNVMIRENLMWSNPIVTGGGRKINGKG